MSREEAMIAYVEEMKKIIETMPMTEKVEELLHVLGPFYEIIEDNKKIHSVSDLSSVVLSPGIGNMLTSTPNLKELNGIQEGSDSGAESESDNEEEEEEDEEKEESEKGNQERTSRGN
ncbi:UNVERIFIED_CONTAM: hypothetical protein FKN15_036654 [Acipenser sinensis]